MSSRLRQSLIHPSRRGILYGVRYSPDGKRLLAFDRPGGVVQVWDAETGKQLTTIDTGLRIRPVAVVTLPPRFAVSPDWRTLFAPRGKHKYERVEQDGKRMIRWTFDGEVRAWNLDDGKLIRTYKHQPPRSIGPIQLSPDGTTFFTSGELPGVYERSAKWAVSLWDVKTGQYRTLPDGLRGDGTFSPDGRTVAFIAFGEDSYARALKLFDTATGQEKWSIPITDKNASVSVGAFSRDGRVIFGTMEVFDRPKTWDSWRTWVKWWDAASGREVVSFEGDKNSSFGDFYPSPDGQTLGVLNWRGDKMRLFLYSIPEKRLLRTVTLCEKTEGQQLIASGLTFHPDGKWLAVITRSYPEKASGDSLDPRDVPQPRILLIEMATGKIRETLVAPQSFSSDACFSPDGRTLATTGSGRVLLWDMTGLAEPTSRQ